MVVVIVAVVGIRVSVVWVVIIVLQWIGVACVELYLMNGKSEAEVSVFLRMVKPPADLWTIGLVVARMSRYLNLCDVCVLRSICGPLHSHSRGSDARDDSVQQLKFGNLEVGHRLVSLPHTSASIQNRLFVGVKELEEGGYLSKLIVVESP